MAPLRVGDLLHGYCGGVFELGTNNQVRVEAIGADWVIARGLDAWSVPQFAQLPPEELVEWVGKSWGYDS